MSDPEILLLHRTILYLCTTMEQHHGKAVQVRICYYMVRVAATLHNVGWHRTTSRNDRTIPYNPGNNRQVF